MMKVAEKIKAYLPVLTEKILDKQDSSFDLIKSRKVISSEMAYCLDAENVVGVYAAVWGNGMFLVGLEDIVRGCNEELYIFYAYDMSGFELPRRVLSAHEITMIIPFNNRYKKPKVVSPSMELVAEKIA